jgi:hypothetical protein
MRFLFSNNRAKLVVIENSIQKDVISKCIKRDGNRLLTADEYSYIKTLPALTKNDDHAYRRLKSQVQLFQNGNTE